jgi:hypothetical protein
LVVFESQGADLPLQIDEQIEPPRKRCVSCCCREGLKKSWRKGQSFKALIVLLGRLETDPAKAARKYQKSTSP